MSTVNQKVYKLFKTKVVSVDEEKKTIRFRFSDNKPDRQDEIVDQKSWNFKSYLANPLFLWGHKSDEPEYVLGTGSDLETDDDGNASYFTAQFDTDINPKADLTFKQAAKGTIRCVSAGFIPHTIEWLDDTPVLKDNELLEISLVPIPANPRAVALEYKAGEITQKDAKWLMESMRAEADLLETQMKNSQPITKEKQMTPEQATALIEGMSRLTEKVDAATAKVDALTAENQTLREQIESEQKAREDADAKAEADKKTADEAEAQRKAEEDAKKDDPAKGGDHDQPGAGESDVIDDDTELTPELQEQIDAELAAEDNDQ